MRLTDLISPEELVEALGTASSPEEYRDLLKNEAEAIKLVTPYCQPLADAGIFESAEELASALALLQAMQAILGKKETVGATIVQRKT